jgi:ParB-like nuclease family protein
VKALPAKPSKRAGQSAPWSFHDMTANLLADPRDRTRACLPAIGHEAIDLLKPNARNPKKHSKRQIGQIARSIKTFGFNVPILVDAELRVIAGHGRLMAARQLGLAQVPTIRLEHLSPEQAKAFAIADNRLTEIGTWDDRLLGEQLRELSEVDLDFSLDVTGFDIPKIDLLIEGVTAEPDSADAVPSARPGLAVSRPGDLWQLGPHRLYCGSAIEESAYQALMGEERAVAVFTDPQRADRRPCQRSRRDPAPRICDGRGRDGRERLHRIPAADLRISGAIQL